MASKMASQDKNKHAFEALERRHAVEAQHQLRNKRQAYEKDHGVNTPAGTSNDAALARKQSTWLNKATEADGLTYSSINHPIHQNLLTALEMSDKGMSIAEKMSNEILRKGDCAPKYMQGYRSVRFDNSIPLDSCVKVNNTSASCLRALKRNAKRSKKHMSLKQLKKCKSFQLTEEFHEFERFMPMHEMWKEYVIQLLKKIGKNQFSKCLLDLDLHGAILRVIECKMDSFAGVVGIMIRETRETFGIITQDNKFRVVPKRGSVFALQADCLRITLYGDKFTSRTLGS